MKKFKRFFAGLLIGAMAAGLSGCGGTQSTVSNQTQGQAETVLGTEETELSQYAVTEPVTFEFWHSVEEDFVNPVVEAFNASQDMITVVPVYVGNYAAIKEQVAAAQAAKEGLPGLCVINFPQVITYAQSGVVVSCGICTDMIRLIFLKCAS